VLLQVQAVASALDSMLPGEEAVMWLDADAIFTNFDFAAHMLLHSSLQPDPEQQESDLLICRDLSVPREKPTCAPICLNTGTATIESEIMHVILTARKQLLCCHTLHSRETPRHREPPGQR
jgi:hypothetical protein